MKQIKSPAQYVTLMRGLRQNQTEEYRWFTFCVRKRVVEGELIYNTMTKEMLLLDDCKFNTTSTINYLKQGLFLVPVENDDIAMVLRLREFARTMNKLREAGYEKYTIFTTTDCNARCYYCFERKWKSVYMTEETAIKIARFIIEDYIKHNNCGIKEIQLDWFGGEPLMNTMVMDVICEQLNRNNVKFKSFITTNGYLFTERMIKRAKNTWKVSRVQITIDGTESVYNKIKAYENLLEGHNPYSQVLCNIDGLINAGIKVDIRVNLTLENRNECERLAYEIASRYANNKYVYMYAATLLEKCDSYSSNYSDERRRELQRQEKKYETLLCTLFKYRRKHLLGRCITTHKCMADNDMTLTFRPDGRITKCEHFEEKYTIGKIEFPLNLDTKIADKYKEESPIMEKCYDCVIFPDCIRLKNCDYDIACYPGRKEYKKEQLLQAMLLKYNQWKKINSRD